MIDVVNCTHHYGAAPVLRDVNLHIDAGKVVAVMGPNGMGKTTLLSLMAGIMLPTRGYVEIDGKRRRRTREEEAAIRKIVAYVPADAYFPATTGRSWLGTIGRLYGHDAIHVQDHIDQLLEVFELTEVAAAFASLGSTGQQKKILLCGAFISEAPILLMDEPFGGGLDPSGIASLKRLLQGMRDRRRNTIVFTTPVPELVEELADEIAVLRDGKLIAFGPLQALRSQAGCDGGLDEVYAQLVSPQRNTVANRYVEERL
jgi:ABC-2 type transport system ATP-binding protein